LEDAAANESLEMNITDWLDNITLTIGNFSQAIYDCALMTELKLINMTAYIAEFTGWNNYLLAFLENLSGNSINLFLIFSNINTATATCDLNTVYTNLGMMALILAKVPPIVGTLGASPY
jgi:hypothetical protein